MLNYNFLNSMKHWSEGLALIDRKAKHKYDDFRQSLEPNNMDATIWLVTKILDNLENCAKQDNLRILVLNSWLGIPIVPLLCENLSVETLHLVDLDREALDISKIFHKHYTQEEFIKIHHHNLDIPFAFEQLNSLEVDIVISINTEQMYPLTELVTRNPFVMFACQNSNVIEEMYGINCVKSCEELAEQIGLDEIFYEGTKKQTYYSWDGRKEFDRYMVMGVK